MQRLVTMSLVTLTALLMVGAPAASAAIPTATAIRVITYAALGDSYSAGVGTRLDYPSSGACRRSPLAYPPLAARNQHSALTFLACSGATTSAVQITQAPHIPSDTDLVTITVGGDDVGFTTVVENCSSRPADQAKCQAAISAGETKIRTVLPARLDTTFTAIRMHAPRARLVVLGYPHLFGSGPCAAPGLPPAAKRSEIDAGTDMLDTVIAARARAAGAAYVDVRTLFQYHGACQGLLQRWINPPTLPPSDSYHPNIRGQDGYVGALLGSST
ncbi:MAG: SGNH/GDSL hydrolase family protein [Actinomycetota bacterium]|nr:SGNH/GDSL hydrolase family protein [Actinomycetota bacterium]